MTDDALAAFIERQRRERKKAGLPEQIVDADALAVIAALIAHKNVPVRN